VSDLNSEVQEVYYAILDNVRDLVTDYDPLIIAGCLVAQGLGIYRTALTEEDFAKIVEGLAANKDEVRTFGGSNLH
jgi:hypothetical protein